MEANWLRFPCLTFLFSVSNYLAFYIFFPPTQNFSARTENIIPIRRNWFSKCLKYCALDCATLIYFYCVRMRVCYCEYECIIKGIDICNCSVYSIWLWGVLKSPILYIFSCFIKSIFPDVYTLQWISKENFRQFISDIFQFRISL